MTNPARNSRIKGVWGNQILVENWNSKLRVPFYKENDHPSPLLVEKGRRIQNKSEVLLGGRETLWEQVPNPVFHPKQLITMAQAISSRLRWIAPPENEAGPCTCTTGKTIP